MGHKHTREEILAGALATARRDGLSQLTYGRVAKQLGISDRIVVYYFPSKHDLVGEVLLAIGLELQVALEATISTPVDDHLALVRATWPVLVDPAADSTFALFFEANGLAAAGREPYRTLVPQLVEGWVAWAVDHIDAATDGRRAEAEAAVALIDGLLLLRQLAGSAACDRAAERLGVTSS